MSANKKITRRSGVQVGTRDVADLGAARAIMPTLAWLRKQSFKPVPLHPRSKAATSRDYINLDYSPPADEFWSQGRHGIGVVLGPAQNGPVDGDLDCEEAIFFAEKFMPTTAAIFGRKSKQRSHRLYKADAAAFEKVSFHDPMRKNQTILELRGDGGHQTVMPGSLHEGTGEQVEWSDGGPGEVPTVNAEELVRAARKVAMATLIVRYAWEPGFHNEPTKHIAGILYYHGWTVEEAVELIEAVMEFTGDTDKSRVATVRGTFKRGAQGKKVTGAGRLKQQLGDELAPVVDRLLEWSGSETVNVLQEYNERFAAGMYGTQFRIARTDTRPGTPPLFLAKNDFTSHYANEYVTVDGKQKRKVELWLNSPKRRTFDEVAFLPGVAEGDEPPGVLNLWNGWAVDPSREGSCDAWLELLRTVICGDETEFKWTLNWFANIVREPKRKPRTALALISPDEGAGKSLLLDYLSQILGTSYVKVDKEDHVTGRFNAHHATCLLLHSEEAMYPGDRKHRSASKRTITDRTITVEKKFNDTVEIPNFLRLVLTSNDHSVVPAGHSDRRYTVIHIGERKASDDLVIRVVAEMEGPGPARLLHHLQNEVDYDPKLITVNLKNEALFDQKMEDRDAIRDWWFEKLMSGTLLAPDLTWAQLPTGYQAREGKASEQETDWPHTVGLIALGCDLKLYLRSQNVRQQAPNEQQLKRRIAEFLKVKNLSGSRVAFVNQNSEGDANIRRETIGLPDRQRTITRLPSLTEARAAFERYIGHAIDWPVYDEEATKAAHESVPDSPHY